MFGELRFEPGKPCHATVEIVEIPVQLLQREAQGEDVLHRVAR